MRLYGEIWENHFLTNCFNADKKWGGVNTFLRYFQRNFGKH